MFNRLSIALKSREPNATLKAHSRRGSDRAVYLSILEKFGSPYFGVVGRLILLHEITNASLMGSTDPLIMFDEIQHLQFRYNCMSTEGMQE